MKQGFVVSEKQLSAIKLYSSGVIIHDQATVGQSTFTIFIVDIINPLQDLYIYGITIMWLVLHNTSTLITVNH